MLDLRWPLLLAVLSACAPGHSGGEPVRASEQALAPGFWIGNVVFDPATYHFDNPANLLMAAEGAGPRTLNVAVSTAMSPQIEFTGTHTPSHSDISKALGYDVSQTFQLTADSSVLVPVDSYARVAAYPSFQKATWTIFGLGTVPMGAGSTYKPIGVYFETCGCIGPDPCGTGCVSSAPSGGAGGAGGAGGGGSGGSGGSASSASPNDADAGDGG
jgi:hypothetical protein